MTDRRLKDKNWRVSHLYKIKDKQSKLIQFKPNRVQKHFDENKHTRNLILKSRQLGITTFEAIDMLDDTLFTRNFSGLFIAQDLDTAKDIFSNKVDLAWQNFPLQELYKVNTDSARQFKFDFGDKTMSSMTVEGSGRSGTYNRLHISELDWVCNKFPDKAKEILEGSIPAVPLMGRIDIETTAKGSEGKFYDMFIDAWTRGNPTTPTQFKAHFYNWTWDDEELALITNEDIISFKNSADFSLFRDYQAQHKLSDREITYYYFKWLSLNKDWGSMKSEYPTTWYECFEGSGNKLFDATKVGKLVPQTGTKVGDWTYYDEWDGRHLYGMGADVAEGVGQDSSTAVIWDFSLTKPKVVATYQNNKISPDLLAYELANGGMKYGMALIAPERNNHGHSTISKLKEIYPEKFIYEEKDKLGWDTNLVTKPKMMFDLSTAVNDELVDIPSIGIIHEMRRYDKEELNTMKFNDETTQHWDLLTACAIGFQMKNHIDKITTKKPAVIYYPKY